MSPTGTPRGARTRAALTLAIAATALTPAAASAAAGDLDASFGTGGKRVLPGTELPLDVLVQPDGKIIEVGGTNVSITGFVVRRLNADGSPDKSFDGNGSALAKFPNLSGSVDAVGSALQPDGSIVVAGNSSLMGVAVARFRPDGSLDPTFGEGGADGDGRVVIPNAFIGFGADDLVLQPGGKIVLAGTQGNDSDIGVVRLRSDGSPDVTGFDPADFGDNNDWANAATGAPDGSVTVVGYTTETSGSIGAVARWKSNGTPDKSFGGTGLVKVPSIEQPTATLLQPDGRLLVAGLSGSDQYKTVVTRLTPSGEVDKTFGSQGTSEIADEDLSNAPSSIAFQPDGKIIVGGSSAPTAENATYEPWVARLDADGHLDAGYGTGGRASYVLGEITVGGTVAVQRDGKVLSAAYTVIGLLPRPVLTRLLADPVPEPETPGGGGEGPSTQDPGGGVANPPRDITAPRLTGLRVVTTRRGRTVQFKLSEQARVQFTVQRTPRHGRAKTLPRGFAIAAAAGTNRIDISRRAVVRRLSSGRYRLLAAPTDASGNRGAATRAVFRVAAKKK
jgi:uncharacterized delta-60 repeat protein